ncbi:Uncharacterized protein Rs2_49659 [Raphanus sativus]|uniref:Uncharacterized protein At2g38710-like n=1 Tax=Raphanus sativus TaxID=3726 RepID=A0A6J0MWR8_RAPSA|nr:uncharacterized protein At2g38710-like [Raphanus sativus]KAJ4868794.1 Uncharacterized protein Rs2_49659 [Raphanus sativus]
MANREMAVYCFDTLVSHYNKEDTPPPAFEDSIHPCFVTWKKAVNGGEPRFRLRGCVGTLEAHRLSSSFKEYALNGALRDHRFPPIQPGELPSLQCTVSIVTDYETPEDYLDWEVGKHGIVIEFSDPVANVKRSATYLPEVPVNEGWTKLEAIDSLVLKAGYDGEITESVRRRIHLSRYQTTLFRMHYSQYIAYVKATRGSVAPTINETSNHAMTLS